MAYALRHGFPLQPGQWLLEQRDTEVVYAPVCVQHFERTLGQIEEAIEELEANGVRLQSQNDVIRTQIYSGLLHKLGSRLPFELSLYFLLSAAQRAVDWRYERFRDDKKLVR